MYPIDGRPSRSDSVNGHTRSPNYVLACKPTDRTYPSELAAGQKPAAVKC